MTAVSERLDAIEARLAKAAPGAITITPSDVAWLRETARKQQAALAKVELACDAMDAGVAIRSGDPRTKSHAAGAIRAAIREAMEDA